MKYREQGTRSIVTPLSHQGSSVKNASFRYPANNVVTVCSMQIALSVTAATAK